MKTRVYLVTTKDGAVRLVEAGNHAQALRHVAKDTFNVSVATTVQVGKLVHGGTAVEVATKEEVSDGGAN